VLERADLGPMLNEITLAVNMGDPQALKRFRRGKFKSTQWFAKFDILKAEPVATATESFDGGVLGSMIGGLTGNYYVGRTAGSVKSAEESGVWVVGLRYKLVDARTSEQVASGYHEAKMELGKQAAGFLGYSQGQKGGVTLDSMTQRLVQAAVQDIDKMKGSASSSRSGGGGSYSAERSRIKNLQQALNDLGFDVGIPDGIPGQKTRTAVSQFQLANGLAVTGELDPATEAKLLDLVGR
jgi:hypothetical protein